MTSDQPLNEAPESAASPAPVSMPEPLAPSPFDVHELDQPDLLEQASRDQWAATGDEAPLLELPAEEAEAAAAEAAAIEAELAEDHEGEGGLLGGDLDGVIRAAAESGYDASGELEKMQRLVSRRWKIKDETQDHYRKIARRLWRETERAARRANPDETTVVTPIDVARHLIGEFANRSEGTWRVYRSAVLWSFGEREHVPEYAAALLLIEQHNPGEQTPGGGADDTKTSVKALPRADLLALLDMLGSMNRTVQWGVRVQYWLQAGLATGLRPAEWQKASWADEEKTVLRVETGKQKADVPAFERRRLEAEGEPHDDDQAETVAPKVRLVPVALRDRTVVDLHMKAVASSGIAFQDYYEYARQTLWKACKRLWKGKKTYSLYSARHQFSANLKAVLPRKEVAAAMGHSRRKNNLYASQKHAYRRGGGERPGSEHADQVETAAVLEQPHAAEPALPQAGTAPA